MKTSLLSFFLVMATSVATLAQTDTVFTGINLRRIALSHVQIRPLAGKHIRGILYALTDSTIIYFYHTRAAMRAFKRGHLPDLDTMSATAVKRLVVQRRSYPWQPVAIGTIVSGILATRIISQSRGLEGLGNAVIAVFFVFPAGPIAGGVVSMFLHRSVRINGDPAELARKRRYLNRYTIETQRQQLRLRTGPTG